MSQSSKPAGIKGWRRVLVVGLAMVLSFVALGLGWLKGDNFNTLWNWLLTAYLASDTGEKAAEAWRARGNGSPIPEQEGPP